jgi:hypothetical protein
LAEPTLLSGESLRSAVAGKTVFLSTPVGSLPIVYRANGTMSGSARQLALYAGTDSDRGVWWVTNDRLCQRWQTWLEGKSYCYRMERNGNTVNWSRDDGRTGTATLSH